MKPHPYLIEKEIEWQAMEPLGCSIEQVTLSCFDSEGKPITPWEGDAIFRPLFLIDTQEHCGHERILSEPVQRNPDEKPKNKLVTKGAKTAGSCTPIGFELADLATLTGRLIVCAGLADGYRLHEATGLPVACGVGELNIPGNVEAIRKLTPTLKLIAAVDNDNAGKRAGQKSGCSWTCPQTEKDWSDVHQMSGSDAVLAEFEDGITPPIKPDSQTTEKTERERQSQSDQIVAFVQTFNELFHDKNNIAHARNIETGEVRSVASKAFRHWLTSAFYQKYERAIRDQSLREAKMTLEGIAMQEQRSVYLRVASVNGQHWLDLAEPGQSAAICIMPGKWDIFDSPVMFPRSESTQPLPRPVRGGSIEPLWRIANIPSHQQLLVTAWLVECLRLDTPFPILEMFGEQGCAKSTTQSALRRLIDPNAADLRAAPKSAEDLYVTGGTNHILSIENVSHLPAPIQDALCVIATGGGFARRKLYSDSDEVVITLKRPAILNGIVAAITQQDAVSRAISIELPVITDACPKDKLEADFERHHAGILGALMDIAARAFEYLPDMTLPAEQRPRLVEFAYLGMAVAKAMNQPPESFMRQFNAARQDGLERTLDASPVASAIRDWAESKCDLIEEHSAKKWLNILEGFKPRNCDSWPRSPRGLGDAMRRAAPALRQLGIECKCLGKIGSTVKWRIGLRNSLVQSHQCLEVVDNTTKKEKLPTSLTSDPSRSIDLPPKTGNSAANRRVF
ncbi:hypothetical protein LPB19_11390 [Marinobacter salinisoli]|uniref:Toprim domain-containing protein n=1 Tax=Marinobacter salinisoli TaxID=2769486 RepID=A0ABX7MNV0_9GAMM|nr:hypothetical protein [Marinobacter salinisoli]QSP93799.1 hypothetical protein LPB19_11390 [Marinobacter salinisoli]